MPQTGMSYEGRSGGTGLNTWKANGQVPGTRWVNGAVVHTDCPAAATRTSESSPAGTQNGTKPQCMVNGHINHGYKGKNTKAAPLRALKKNGSWIPAVTEASAAGRDRSAGPPGDVSVNGATGRDTVASQCNSGQTAPPSGLSTAAVKKRRRSGKCKRRERTTVLHSLPPREEEDWESEIQDVTLSNWEKNSFGINPYGPDDVLHFALRGWTLKQKDSVDLPVTANYSPAIHHLQPVLWTCYSIPTEPDQFADAAD